MLEVRWHSSNLAVETSEVFMAAKDKIERYHLDLSDSRLTFEILIRYPGQTELRIPVENDVVPPEKATLPKGFSIRQEK